MSTYFTTVKDKVESAWNPWVDAGNLHFQSFKSFTELKNNALKSAETQSTVSTILNFPQVVLVDWPVSYCWNVIHNKIYRKQWYESKKIQIAEKIFPDIESLQKKCEKFETQINSFQNNIQNNFSLTCPIKYDSRFIPQSLNLLAKDVFIFSFNSAIKYDPLFIPSSLNFLTQDMLICAKDINTAISKLHQVQTKVNEFFIGTINKADTILQYDPNIDDTPHATELDECDEIFWGAEQTRKKVQYHMTHVARAVVVIPTELVQGEFNYAFKEVTNEIRMKPISIVFDATFKHAPPYAIKQVIKWYLLDLTGSVLASGLRYSCIYLTGYEENAISVIPFLYLQHVIVWGTRAYLVKNTLRTWQEDRAKATDSYKYKINDILTRNLNRIHAVYDEKIVKPTSSIATTVAESMPSIVNNVASWCSDIWNKVKVS